MKQRLKPVKKISVLALSIVFGVLAVLLISAFHTLAAEIGEYSGAGAQAVIDHGKIDNDWGCIEEEPAVLDIVGGHGSIGDEIYIPVHIQSAPTLVSSLGFEITYNPYVLGYLDFERGELVTLFDIVNINYIEPGRLLVGGFSYTNDIPEGTSGYLLYLKFFVQGIQDTTCYPLQFESQLDDISDFSSTGGCFCVHSSDGDINGDGSITPQDALLIFQCYLGSGACPYGADVNQDGLIVPSDSLCVFKKYLKLPSCLDKILCNDIDKDGFAIEGADCGPIDCEHNSISSIELINCPNLELLNLGYSEISDLSFLTCITALHSVDLSGNPLQDISPLLESPWIGKGDFINLSYTERVISLSDARLAEICAVIQKLRSKGVNVKHTLSDILAAPQAY
ncbi:MAG: leucine-rich repeat domain-containing protein [bacterium]